MSQQLSPIQAVLGSWFSRLTETDEDRSFGSRTMYGCSARVTQKNPELAALLLKEITDNDRHTEELVELTVELLETVCLEAIKGVGED